MSLQYIIDGYNLIRHRAFAGCSKIKDGKRALIDFIQTKRPCGSLKNRVLVVFDGYAGERWQAAAQIEVVFSCDISADEKIRRILESGPRNKSVIVVSDDRQVRDFCRLNNAQALTVEEFLAPRKRAPAAREQDVAKPELSFTQAQKINRELKQLWLGE